MMLDAIENAGKPAALERALLAASADQGATAADEEASGDISAALR